MEAAVQEALAVACESPAALFHSENPIGWITKTLRRRAQRIIDGRRRTDALLVALKALAPKPGIKLPACYKRYERVRDRLRQDLDKYYKYRSFFLRRLPKFKKFFHDCLGLV